MYILLISEHSFFNGVAKAALFGTMRHQLFEQVMTEKDFNLATLRANIKTIVRLNAEGILACGVSSDEAERELSKVIGQLVNFANTYTTFGPRSTTTRTTPQVVLENSAGSHSRTTFLVESINVVEESVISPELGLKGNIDLIVNAKTGQHGIPNMVSSSLIGVELKTGHNQKTQNAHSAQLALYVLMMKCSFGSTKVKNSEVIGASESGVLLYLNNDAIRAVQIAPMLSEIKSLIGQRNVVAIELLRVMKPRTQTFRSENNNAALVSDEK
jgi:DNA replication ATP-dependent helicase Dna2